MGLTRRRQTGSLTDVCEKAPPEGRGLCVTAQSTWGLGAVKAPKAEPRAHAVSVEAVSRYGTAQGNHATDSGGRILPGGGKSLYAGPGLNNVGPTPSTPGPGGGRQVQHCGSQGQHGEVAGTPFQASHRGWEPVGRWEVAPWTKQH
jgi:hypothetical protein